MFLCPFEDLQYIEAELGVSVENLRNKVICLTGATGGVGKNLLESLVWLNRSNKLNLEIYAISRSPEIFFKNYSHFREYSELFLVSGDIRDEKILFSGTQIDYCIHAAADVINKNGYEELFSACIEGTSKILKFAKNNRCKNFLLLSSGAVYGRQPQNLAAFSENYIGGVSLSSTQSAYALGKQCSEWLTQQEDVMNIQIARCFAFAGPYLPLNQHFAVGNFIKSALAGENIEIQGNGTPIRTYLYTSDLCIWLIKLMLEDGRKNVWNIGGSEPISIKALAELVREEVNPDININIQQPIELDVERYVPDVSKIERELMLKPGVSLREMINKMAQWNLSQGAISNN